MPLVTAKKMLEDACRGNYAVGALNCENMEMVQAVISAAEECCAPVMVQTTSSTLQYASPSLFAANVTAVSASARIPVALHLDHSNRYETAVKALAAGYTSIMYDGSRYSLKENIVRTRQVVELCSAVSIPVEGELGQVGGKEDDVVSASCAYTDPREAECFVTETGVSSLAVGVGTAHGVYAVTPTLNLPLISELRQRIPVPLVLHGASGLSDQIIQECIARGIAKVNFATELRIAYTKAVSDYLEQHPDCIDPKAYGCKAREAVKQLVMTRMLVCGCDGKALPASN